MKRANLYILILGTCLDNILIDLSVSKRPKGMNTPIPKSAKPLAQPLVKQGDIQIIRDTQRGGGVAELSGELFFCLNSDFDAFGSKSHL